MAYFILRKPRAPWGGYGAILTHGMSRRLGRDAHGMMQLERTGPFVPPITFPASVEPVVTAAFRDVLEGSNLSGVSYKEVRVVTAASVEWEAWDRTTRLPPVIPPSGEPEDYVPEGQHDPACARAMGRLWEVITSSWGTGSSRMIAHRKYSTELRIDSNHPDFFRVNGLGMMFVSEVARAWLEKAVPDWVAFEEVVQS